MIQGIQQQVCIFAIGVPGLHDFDKGLSGVLLPTSFGGKGALVGHDIQFHAALIW